MLEAAEISAAVTALTSELEVTRLVAHTLTWVVRPMFCMVLNI